MKRTLLKLAAITLGAASALACGCKSAPSDADAIRAGINQHLTSLKTLNLSAMDMDVNNVSIQGNQAHAQVTFRPKNSPPSGAGMQVAYQLEKRDSAWFVVKTEAVGSGFQHPDANANPHAQAVQGEMHGAMPNFRDILPSTASGASATLPPGHPAVNTGSQTNSADSNWKPN